MSLQPILEIGGTHVTAATVDARSWTVRDQRRSLLESSASTEEILRTLCRAAGSIPQVRQKRWGIAIPGPFDYRRGIGDFDGVAKLGGLRGVDLVRELGERLRGLADEFVFVNDADAFAMGEWTSLPAAARRAVFLTLGTGIGSSFLVDGRPRAEGTDVPRRGHVYLLVWEGRPIEETISRRALVARYEAASGRHLDVREIADRARSGDACAQDVMDGAFFALGACLAPVIDRFGADVLVVGGSITGAWSLVRPAFLCGLTRDFPMLETLAVERAKDPDRSPLIGTARAAQMFRPAGSG